MLEDSSCHSSLSVAWQCTASMLVTPLTTTLSPSPPSSAAATEAASAAATAAGRTPATKLYAKSFKPKKGNTPLTQPFSACAKSVGRTSRVAKEAYSRGGCVRGRGQAGGRGRGKAGSRERGGGRKGKGSITHSQLDATTQDKGA